LKGKICHKDTKAQSFILRADPAIIPIFYVENRRKRIFPSIGARVSVKNNLSKSHDPNEVNWRRNSRIVNKKFVIHVLKS
jgi:hypothetical protein